MYLDTYTYICHIYSNEKIIVLCLNQELELYYKYVLCFIQTEQRLAFLPCSTNNLTMILINKMKKNIIKFVHYRKPVEFE